MNRHAVRDPVVHDVGRARQDAHAGALRVDVERLGQQRPLRDAADERLRPQLRRAAGAHVEVA